MILLDTHPLFWFSEGDEQLGKQASQLIQEEIAQNQALVSPISFWEVAMLTAKRRLVVARSTLEWAEAVQSLGRLRIAEMTPAIAVDAGELPGDIHGDPADRIIVATARAIGGAVVTADRKILRYAEAGHVRAINARR